MSCFPELTYSIYVDGELPAYEARQVEAHLSACAICRALVEALKAENRSLMHALQPREDEVAVARSLRSGPPVPAATPGPAFSLLWPFLGTFLGTTGAVAVVSWLAGRFPSTTDWINPFNRTTLLNLFWSGVIYLANQGESMLQEFEAVFATFALGLMALAAAFFILRRRSASVVLLFGLALAFLPAQSAYAFEKRVGKTVRIPSGETINGTLLASGETLDIEGIVNGDVFTFARRVIIRGTVKGDVIGANQSLEVDGKVDGNVYTFAQALRVRGGIARSLYAWAQVFELDSAGHVDNDVMAGSAQAGLNGNVGRDASCFCGSLELRGSVGRDLTPYAGNVTLMAPARVGGDFIAHVHKKDHVQIDSGVTIAGRTEIKVPGPRPSRYARPKFYFWQGIQLVAALLTGLALFWLFPRLFPDRMASTGQALRAAGIGFLILVATPIAAFIAAITLVGLPVALIGCAVWITALYLAKVFVASLIGQATLQPAAGQPRSVAPALLVGLLIIFVAINLPYLGGLIKFVVLLLGLGAAFNQVHREWRRAAAPSPGPAMST